MTNLLYFVNIFNKNTESINNKKWILKQREKEFYKAESNTAVPKVQLSSLKPFPTINEIK